MSVINKNDFITLASELVQGKELSLEAIEIFEPILFLNSKIKNIYQVKYIIVFLQEAYLKIQMTDGVNI